MQDYERKRQKKNINKREERIRSEINGKRLIFRYRIRILQMLLYFMTTARTKLRLLRQFASTNPALPTAHTAFHLSYLIGHTDLVSCYVINVPASCRLLS